MSSSVELEPSPRGKSSERVAWRWRRKKYQYRLRARLVAMRCSHVKSDESPRNRARPLCARMNVSLQVSSSASAWVADQGLRDHERRLLPVAGHDLEERGFVARIEALDENRVIRRLAGGRGALCNATLGGLR